MTPRIQILMRPNLCHTGPSISVTRRWYDVIELCVKHYVRHNEKAIEFVALEKRDNYNGSHTLN